MQALSPTHRRASLDQHAPRAEAQPPSSAASGSGPSAAHCAPPPLVLDFSWQEPDLQLLFDATSGPLPLGAGGESAASIDPGVVGAWRDRCAAVERSPDQVLSPELERAYRGGWRASGSETHKDVVFVSQSEGQVSARLPLVSSQFAECTAYLFRNETTGDCLLLHHDSGVRGEWGAELAREGCMPLSPTTPRRGLLGRPRSGLKGFLETPGRKRMVAIESQRAYDRRDVIHELRDRCPELEVVQPLVLATQDGGGSEDCAEWDVAYRPLTDELMVHLKDGTRSRVLHFPDALANDAGGASPVPLLRRLPRGEGDIVDRLSELQAILGTAGAGLSGAAKGALWNCLTIVRMRNRCADEARRALDNLVRDPNIPKPFLDSLRLGGFEKEGDEGIRALTALAETIARMPRETAPAATGHLDLGN